MAENTSRRAPGYHPPPFPLFQATFGGDGGDPQRWLVGWNGLVHEPATDVTLAARGEGVLALVTSSRWSSDLDARLAAVRLLATRDETLSLDSIAAQTAHAHDETRWAPAAVDIDGHLRIFRATARGGSTSAYCTDADAQLAFASCGAVALRRVRSGAARYTADPLVSHAYAELPPVAPLARIRVGPPLSTKPRGLRLCSGDPRVDSTGSVHDTGAT